MGDGRRRGWRGGGWCCDAATRVQFPLPPPPLPWVLVLVGDGQRETGGRVVGGVVMWPCGRGGGVCGCGRCGRGSRGRRRAAGRGAGGHAGTMGGWVGWR